MRRPQYAVAAGLAFAALALVAFAARAVKPFSVYHDGDGLVFSPSLTGSHQMASFGPWNFGERLRDPRPTDKRLNLYVVIPGSQYRSPNHSEYDHNRVINKYTVDNKPREWDIYWCFVLDPSLTADVRSERELLIAAHESFKPADLYDASDAPSHIALAEQLRVHSLSDLRRFRRKDGSLPRVLILPASLAVRATAEVPDVSMNRSRPR